MDLIESMSKENINSGRTKLKTIYHCIVFSFCMLIGGTIAAFIPGEIAEKVGGLSQAGLFLFEAALRLIAVIGFSFYYIKINHRFTMSEFRIKKPKTMLFTLPAAIIIPALLTGFFIVFIPGEFTVTDVSPYLLFTILIGTILTNGIILALFDEIWLRGGVLHFLEIGFGRKIAVVFLTLSVGIFTVLGFVFGFTVYTSPADLILLTVFNMMFSLMLSLITITADSVFPAVIIHAFWNIIMQSDLIYVTSNPTRHSIYTYQIAGQPEWLSGGYFGASVSLPAIIILVAVSAVCLLILKNKQTKMPQSAADTPISDEAKLYYKFIEDIYGKTDKEHIKKLNEEQKNAYIILSYDSDVQNGGHLSFFDWCADIFTPEEVINALNAVGASHFVKIYEKAVRDLKYDERCGYMPYDFDDDNDEDDDDEYDDFKELDEPFYELSPDLTELLKKYVWEKKDLIFTPHP
jgi:membrane protease YdiL (CAAX protease family)